ncbi:MAG: alanine racemase [Thalassolituus sp.]|uniref:alanine racemase n=1 Tax=Thalassolituus sp. TaxID=2030822 RepID=UPI003981AF67
MSDAYFKAMTAALHTAGVCTPTLIIDRARLDRNIDHVIDVLNKGFEYRLVTKSLPSIPLLQYVMRRTGTQRLMCFHLPFLLQLVNHIPSSDILMGKPMPVRAAQEFYDWHSGQTSSMCFAPELQLQWLIDSMERLEQYEKLASQRNLRLRICLEIDVGLHRGGFRNTADFTAALRFIRRSNYLTLSGLMGYEAHITKMPIILGGIKSAFADTQGRYANFLRAAKAELGDHILDNLCINTGGSTTYTLYHNSKLVNEIAAGAALVMPSNFSAETLEHHHKAAFIAAPILKNISKPEIPLTPAISTMLRILGVLPKRACFIYGGNWLADPCYPEDTQHCKIFGRSSNQEMYGIPVDSDIKQDDFIFMTPQQSESVFLQFGTIGVYEDGRISAWWNVFQENDIEQPPVYSDITTAEVYPLK